MSYSPRPGSIADRAHQVLSARGELSGAALADAIELDDWKTLLPSLTVPLAQGYIKRTLRDGLNWYSVGDGIKVTPKPDADDGNDDHPIVQRLVPAAPPPKPAPKAAKQRAPKPVQTPAAAATPTPPSAGQAVFGLYTDGRLVIEQGAQRIELSSAEHKRLYAAMVEGEL